MPDSPAAPAATPLHVVLFSGGRGGDALVRRLAGDPRIHLTIAINGYDDGASTGEVRRFLGDCLGPSDFRKNASRVARVLQASPEALTCALDFRLPVPCPPATALALFAVCRGDVPPATDLDRQLDALMRGMDTESRAGFVGALGAFEREYGSGGRPFEFGDCALGNLVFAGCFLECGRDFNGAVDRYSALCGLPPGIVENVTDGTDAYLVAITESGEVLATEAEIVDARRRNVVRDIYLLRNRLSADDVRRLSQTSCEAADAVLTERAAALRLNPRLADRISRADLIIFAPGTQHSSLFPSYLTSELGGALAANARAHKLMVTNLQADAEIHGASGVDLVQRALYYLREKNRRPYVTPSLVSLCLINEPEEESAAHVRPGEVERLEDLRLVRVANYEDRDTGRHDSAKVLEPFLDELLERRTPRRLAMLLTDSESDAKLAQTVLEMIRGGLTDLPLQVEVFYARAEPLQASFNESVPFPLRRLEPRPGVTQAFVKACRDMHADYVALIDSSGMYNGEDVARLAAVVASRRADAVWGSRRLSLREIHASYRLRYRHSPMLGAISYLGSHVLSVIYLLLYGRYVSDTLSEMRVCRLAYLDGLDVSHAAVNHELLSRLLRDHAEIVEVPVQFLPLSPRAVRRTTVGDGIRALGTILRWRFAPPLRTVAPDHPATANAEPPLVAPRQ